MDVKENVIESRRVSWLHVTTYNRSEIASLLAEGLDSSWGRGRKEDGGA
jgi:hypothetical protein